MSAYIVSNETINCIVNGMIDNRVIDTMSAIKVGQELYNQNAKSLNYRYDEDNEAPKFQFARRGVLFEIEGVPVLYDANNVYTDNDIYGCIQCWMYQSCEDPDHRDSYAWRYVERLERKIIDKKFPDYPWGLE